MADVATIRKLLEEYGIRNASELEDAMTRMKKVNIGVFAAPTDENRRSEHEKSNRGIGGSSRHIDSLDRNGIPGKPLAYAEAQ